MTVFAQESQTTTITGKPAALVVKMAMFAPYRGEADIRSQLAEAFPGVPVIFVDQGTSIGVIHAVE